MTEDENFTAFIKELDDFIDELHELRRRQLIAKRDALQDRMLKILLGLLVVEALVAVVYLIVVCVAVISSK